MAIHAALCAHRSQNHALISKMNNTNDSCSEAYDVMQNTNIPRTYIGISYDFDTFEDLM